MIQWLRVVTMMGVALGVLAVPSAQQPAVTFVVVPPGTAVSCTTAYSIDQDCDGYGVGHGYVRGPDADDLDPTVNTLATVVATYGDVATFLSTNKGLSPKATWYLSPLGDDTTCVRNDATKPCKTYAVARTKVAASEMLLIRGGTYDEAQKPFNFPGYAGTAAQPTVVMAYPGEDVILRRTADGSDPYGMYLSADHAILDGIWLTTVNPNHGKGIEITKVAPLIDVTIRNSEVSNFYTNIFGCFGGQDLKIQGNVLHDGKGEHNIYTCNNQGNTGHQVATVIEDNVMYSAQWNNIHLNTNHCDGCIIRRNLLWSSNETGGGTANIAIQSGFKDGDIDSNVLFNYSGFGLLFNTYTDAQTGIGVPSDMTGNTIANNTMVDTGRDLVGHNFTGQCMAGIAVQNTSKVAGVDLGHNFYLNNVLVHAMSGSPNCAAQMAYTQVNDLDLPWWTTDTFQHNTLYAPDGAAPLSIGPKGTSIPGGRKTWAEFGMLAGTFIGNVQTDPQLQHFLHTDYNVPLRFNLRLLPTSPVIGQGLVDPRVPLVDVRRKTRTTPEMGAYEYP